MVVKAGSDFFLTIGEGYPGLDAVQGGFVGPFGVGRSLGVGNTFACDHPVHGSGAYFLNRAQAVPMENRAFKQIGHCGQVDVGMRPDVNAFTRGKDGWAEVIKKDERPHHGPHFAGKQATGFKAPQVLHMGGDDGVDGVSHGNELGEDDNN
jgi:hypothetical protein